MSIGPLRRSVGALGLLALVPVAAMLVIGTLDPVEAAQRAVVTFAVLLLLGRLASWGVDGIASSLEREDEPRGDRRAAASPVRVGSAPVERRAAAGDEAA